MQNLDDNDKPRFPSSHVDPLLVKFKPLYGNVRIDSNKKNVEKEAARVTDCLKKQGFIWSGISKYIEFQRFGMRRNSKYADDMQPYVKYWEQIEAEINVSLPPTPIKLMEYFGQSWTRRSTMPPTF